MTDRTELEADEGPTPPRRPGPFERAITEVLEWAATALLFGLTILVFANAVGRYAFSSPLPWTEEVAINLMVWMVGVGVVLAGMRQSLICCNILFDRISSRGAVRLGLFCAVLGAAVMAYFSWLTWRYIGVFGKDLSPILGIPKYVGMSGLFFASVGLCATLLIHIFRRKEV